MEETKKSPEVLKHEEDLRISKLKNQIDSEKRNTFKNAILSKSLIGIFGIITFVVVTFVSLQIFTSYEIDKTLSPVFSLIAGGFTTYIILIAGKILKEFTIKGGTLELSAKLQEEIINVRKDVEHSNKEINTKINSINQNFLSNFQDINLKIDHAISSIVNSSAHSENTVNNYYDTSREFTAKVRHSGIPDSKIDPEQNISSIQMDPKIDELFSRLKFLEENLKNPVELTVPEMMTRANYHYYKNRHSKAIEWYSKVLEEEPENEDALFNIAYSYSKLHEHKKAISYYEKLLSITPESIETLNNIGFSYGNLKNYLKAEEYYKKCLTIQPNYELAFNNLIGAYKLSGKFDEAVDLLSKKYEKEPNNHHLISSIANVYLIQRDFAKSKEFAKKVLTFPSQTAQDIIDKITANIILENYKIALDLCEDNLLDDNFKNLVLYNKACCYSRLNNIKKAIDLLTELIAKDSDWKRNISIDPDFDDLRNDPDFTKLINS